MIDSFFASIRGGLIVSCQALADEPLHSPFIMGRMAKAQRREAPLPSGRTGPTMCRPLRKRRQRPSSDW